MCSNLFLAMAPKGKSNPAPKQIKVRKSRAKVLVGIQPRQVKGRFGGHAVKDEPIDVPAGEQTDPVPEEPLVVTAPDRTSFDGSDVALLEAVLETSDVDVLENGCGTCCREWSEMVVRRRHRGIVCKPCSNLMVNISPVTISEFRAYEFH